MSKKNLIAGQSGGPTAAINSSLYGVVSEALKHTEEIDHVYGMVNGIEGFLNGTVLDFQEALPGEQLLALTWTPGAYLGSSSRPPLPWAPAAISFRNLWKIRFIRSCSGNSRR